MTDERSDRHEDCGIATPAFSCTVETERVVALLAPQRCRGLVCLLAFKPFEVAGSIRIRRERAKWPVAAATGALAIEFVRTAKGKIVIGQRLLDVRAAGTQSGTRARRRRSEHGDERDAQAQGHARWGLAAIASLGHAVSLARPRLPSTPVPSRDGRGCARRNPIVIAGP